MSKRLAVIVRDRQSEAFRMSIGLTILEDRVDIYLVEPLLEDDETSLQLDGAREIGIPIFSTLSDLGFPKISIQEMAERLLESDHIIAY